MLDLDFEVRSIDGTGNNTQPERQDWGAAGEPLDRLLDPAYADDVSALAGADRPNPRDISNAVFMQSGDMPIAEGYSDLLTVWGQFLAHDIDLTPDNGSETAPVAVPTGDSWFDPLGFGGVEIPFHRSGFVEGTGTDPDNPREHPNVITGYIDASMVYGSDAEREAFLRDEGGRLKVSDGNLLPFNDPDDPIDNAGANGDTSFVAGDVRANENVVLLSLHTTSSTSTTTRWSGWRRRTPAPRRNGSTRRRRCSSRRRSSTSPMRSSCRSWWARVRCRPMRATIRTWTRPC